MQAGTVSVSVCMAFLYSQFSELKNVGNIMRRYFAGKNQYKGMSLIITSISKLCRGHTVCLPKIICEST